MSKIALILGFSYALIPPGSVEDYKLPGILVDLYLAYRWAKTIKCDKILVITDFIPENMGKVILNAIINGDIDSNINFFVDNLKKNKELIIFSTINNLRDLIVKTCSYGTHLYFYYSGHSKDGYILIPKYKHLATYLKKSDEDPFHRVKLETIIGPGIDSLKTPGEVLIILDCCNSDNFMLPYELQIYVASSQNGLPTHINDKATVAQILRTRTPDIDIYSKYTMHDITQYPGHGDRRVICISSSGIFSNAYSEHGGSNFTIHLFKLLAEKDIVRLESLVFLLSVKLLDISGIRTTVRSSHPNLLQIQPWMRNSGGVSVYYSNIKKVFTIKG